MDNTYFDRRRKWAKEHDYRLIKELWAYEGNRIAVRFAYEWHNDNDEWFRSYGNENWEFDQNGLMQRRYAPASMIYRSMKLTDNSIGRWAGVQMIILG